MAQTFTHLLNHVIFSTKERRPLLKAEIRPRLFSYMGRPPVQARSVSSKDRKHRRNQDSATPSHD